MGLDFSGRWSSRRHFFSTVISADVCDSSIGNSVSPKTRIRSRHKGAVLMAYNMLVMDESGVE